MGVQRRYMRRMAREMAKDIKKNGPRLNLPTEQDLEQYINKKIEELKKENDYKKNGTQV